MKLTSLPEIYKNIKRWSEVLTILSKYGLADWLERFNIPFLRNHFRDRNGQVIGQHSYEARIRMALTELGPTFIKLGQLLSTRLDLITPELAKELEQLQTRVPADDFDEIALTIKEELGQEVETLFADFEKTPFASASIGQVHRATLGDGQKIVVKVQHRNIENQVQENLEILQTLAQLAEHIPELQRYRPIETTRGISRLVRQELDFKREKRNLLFFAKHNKNQKLIIPEPLEEYCTDRVLVMQELEGPSLGQFSQDPSVEEKRSDEFDRESFVETVSNFYLDAVFSHGIYHADPHPGNFILLDKKKTGLVDFGMVGRLPETLQEEIMEAILALKDQNAATLTEILIRTCQTEEEVHEEALAGEVAQFLYEYLDQPILDIHLGNIFAEVNSILRRHHLVLPTEVTLLIKTLISLEGTVRLVLPSYTLLDLLRSHSQKLLFRKLSPFRKLRRMNRIVGGMERLAEVFPKRTIKILNQIESGKFDLHLNHRGLEPSVNRLVLGLLTSSLFLGSTILLSQEVPPLIFANREFWGMTKISILGFSGCVASLLLGVRLVLAIAKSGHLNRKK
ncbi:MAG: AarF/UbiB family protein [Pirellulaceae bacterium]|nr:AarF/UbiB family protein [Pirellulaceae bacterium]